MQHQLTRFIAALLMTGLAATAQAQDEPAAQPPAPDCSTEDHRAFDFWVGDWEVYSGDQKAGRNTITRTLDGCVLQENWRGSQGSRGTSLNYFDRADQRWHQVWVDARGGVLNLAGGLDDEGRMVLSGTRPASAGGQDGSAEAGESVTMEHRITWTPAADGSVNQHWQSRSEQGEWQTLFNGEYRPAKPD